MRKLHTSLIFKEKSELGTVVCSVQMITPVVHVKYHNKAEKYGKMKLIYTMRKMGVSKIKKNSQEKLKT